jgi:hypothetical protein
MLRSLVVFLLLANLVFYGWTQGWLAGVLGLSPDGDREPQRLLTQIESAALRVHAPTAVVTPGPAAAAPPPAAAASAAAAAQPASEAASQTETAPEPVAATEPPPICLEAGPFNPVEWRSAETALRGILGDGNWTLTTREKPGNWMVYVGPYKSHIIMDKRADQLRQMAIAFEEARGLPDEYIPGFVFGRYGVEADARALQARLTAQKIKYVRVVPLVKPTATHTVRIPRADADAQARLQALKPRLSGHAFVPCRDDGRRP